MPKYILTEDKKYKGYYKISKSENDIMFTSECVKRIHEWISVFDLKETDYIIK